MNEDLKIANIETKNANNTFTVKIDNTPQAAIEAHNASSDAHKSIIGTIIEKTNVLEGMINEFEDNLVLPSDIPTKVSNLENDLNFMNETALANALEIRGVVNTDTLNGALNEQTAGIMQNVNDSLNTINTRIDTVENSLSSASSDPETISGYGIMNLSNYVNLNVKTTGTEITAPANGIFLTEFTTTNTNGSFLYWRQDTDGNSLEKKTTCYTKGTKSFAEVCVNKGEVVSFLWTNCSITYTRFYYLNGSAPKNTEA